MAMRRPIGSAESLLRPIRSCLAEVLACLGSARLANNLNQLAKAANTGALYCDAETKAELIRACDDVRAMRLLLMEALGLRRSKTIIAPRNPRPRASPVLRRNRRGSRHDPEGFAARRRKAAGRASAQ
jgi:hypothetical protein